MKLTKKGRKVRDRIIMVIVALLIISHLHVFILVAVAASLALGIYIGRQHSPKTVVKTVSNKTNKKRA
jgi:amino acid permease